MTTMTPSIADVVAQLHAKAQESRASLAETLAKAEATLADLPGANRTIGVEIIATLRRIHASLVTFEAGLPKAKASPP